MQISPRFSAAHVFFHPVSSPNHIPDKDNNWIWQDLDTLGQMTESHPFKEQLDGLDPHILIEFSPKPIRNTFWESWTSSHMAKITLLDEEGNPDNALESVKVYRNLGILHALNILEPLSLFLNNVLSAAKVMNRSLPLPKTAKEMD